MIKASSAFGAIVTVSVLAGCTMQGGPAQVLPPVDPASNETHRWQASKPVAVESFGQDNAKQFGELRVPAGKGPFPVAMLVHGGCWAGLGHVNNMALIADWLRERGVATWNVDYREPKTGGGWPGTFQDWASGLAALKTLAGRYPLDLARITTVGHSAGVLPGIWLASGSQGDGVMARDLPDIRAVIAIDGPIDVKPFRALDDQACGGPVIDTLMGGSPETVPARYAMIDPRTNPPIIDELLIVDGWLPPHEPAMIDSLEARGIKVSMVAVNQDDHFSMLKPGTADFNAYAPAMLRVTRGR